MKTYIISVLVVAISLTVAQLVIPKGRIKTAVEAAISVIFIAAVISPLTDLNVFNFFDTEAVSANSEQKIEYLDKGVEKYCAKYIKDRLERIDLIAEKVEVEISRGEINKIDIYLSNLVIEENNEHINNTVIENYVAEKLSLNPEIIKVHV